MSLGPGAGNQNGKLILALQRCIAATFDLGRWTELGYETDTIDLIDPFDRLKKSLRFGDPDYTDQVFSYLKRVEHRCGTKGLQEVADAVGLTAWLLANDRVLLGTVASQIGAAPPPTAAPGGPVAVPPIGGGLRALLASVLTLSPGKADAYKYESAIFALLSAAFAPSLKDMAKQKLIAADTKRVDLFARNEATAGFFHWLPSHSWPSAYIFLECKNYSTDVSNPEIDQLLGRLSVNYGLVGLLVCRSVDDPVELHKRCRAAADKRQGYVLALTDDDLGVLVDQALANQDFPLLHAKFEALLV